MSLFWALCDSYMFSVFREAQWRCMMVKKEPLDKLNWSWVCLWCLNTGSWLVLGVCCSCSAFQKQLIFFWFWVYLFVPLKCLILFWFWGQFICAPTFYQYIPGHKSPDVIWKICVMNKPKLKLLFCDNVQLHLDNHFERFIKVSAVLDTYGKADTIF